MTDRKLQGEEVDRLLRETLTADLPPQDEARLRSSLRQAWAAAREEGTYTEGRPVPLREAASMAEAALGAAAGLLLALSLALHLALPPRLVAASLSIQNASLRVASQLRRAVAMTCVLDTIDDEGLPRRYHIAWRTPDEARVRVEDAAGEATWLVKVPPSPAGFAEGRSGTSAAEAGDLRLQAVREFLSPDGVGRLLAGRWDRVHDGAAEPGRTTFDVAGARQRVRATIDRATDLPLQIEARGTATLAWTLREEAPLPLAGVAPNSVRGGSR